MYLVRQVESNGGVHPCNVPSDNEAGALREPPEALLDEPGARLWHKLDRSFRTPRACAFFVLSNTAAYASPRAAAATHLALKLLHDDLNETTYLADVAGLRYDVSSFTTCALAFV